MRKPMFRFLVLGPWAVVDGGGQSVAVPTGPMRVVLNLMLVSIGQSMSAETLATRMWPTRMPPRARPMVHTYVARLRRVLGTDVIHTTPAGYHLETPRSQVDLWQFRDLLGRAAVADSASEELRLLREALKLWRGRPFSGAESEWLEQEFVPRLDEAWFTATERRIDLEMLTTPPSSLLPELIDLARTFSTRESLWLRLIDAMHRSGRRAEALDAYRQARLRLAEESGLEPSEALQQAHRRVLEDGTPTGKSEEAAAPVPPEVFAPRQLPHDVANFSSREELAQLHRLMAAVDREPRLTHIVVLEGTAGIGKTTLAVHWAHQIARAYPDLQLYLNLRGYGPGEPMSPSSAAETLLRGLGVRNDLIPPGAHERAALLRSTLAGRRVLVLLDNARDAEQVRPLFPGADSLVVITSRHQLRGLSIRDGAHRMTLGSLSPSEALALLAATFGPDRVAAEREAATRVVELCDGLPLALAIVAERAQREGGLTEVVRALLDERERLDVFGDGEGDPHSDLWVALSWSYRALGADAAALFRRLGLHPADEISLATAAALAGVDERQAQQLLDRLVAAHLVRQRHPQRYELHDLVRWYARERAGRDESVTDRTEAVRRVLDSYLHTAVSADGHLMPHRRRDFVAPYQPSTVPPEFVDATAAMAWFEREYDSLRAAAAWAGRNGWAGHAWRIILAMTTYFERRIPWYDAIELHLRALEATETGGERAGEGYVLNALACMHYFKGDSDQAVAHWQRALDCFRDTGHAHGEAMLLGNLGMIYAERGDHETAQRYAWPALRLCESFGYDRGCALNLDNLGMALCSAGDYDAAIESHLRAQAINRRLGDENSEAMNQHHLGRAYTAAGHHRQALRAFREARTRYRALDNARLDALVRIDVGRALWRAGHGALAQGVWDAAVATLKDFDGPHAQQIDAIVSAARADTEVAMPDGRVTEKWAVTEPEVVRLGRNS
jgi:DNA-binding SARP family transcriptional activator/tetratricopeptide (TPR) repeat protein